MGEFIPLFVRSDEEEGEDDNDEFMFEDFSERTSLAADAVVGRDNVEGLFPLVEFFRVLPGGCRLIFLVSWIGNDD